MSYEKSDSELITRLLAQQGKDLTLQSLQVLQPLWAGYGHVYHATASPKSPKNTPGEKTRFVDSKKRDEAHSFVIKVIKPPPAKPDNEGHIRKILSYQVEQYFYAHLAPQMPPNLVPIARCSASINDHTPEGKSTIAMILSDLRQDFPRDPSGFLSANEVHAAITWLSSFHGFWWPRVKELDRESLLRPPLEESKRQWPAMDKPAIWLNGGYTYLATRRTEYENLAGDHDSEWRSELTQPKETMAPWKTGVGEIVARYLAPSVDGKGPTDEYQTVIHGDVKADNLFSNDAGDAVAFYDFQYTGLGLGVCDLAKLFTCAVPLDMLAKTNDPYSLPSALAMQQAERDLLEAYRENLQRVSGKTYPQEIFELHWETALVDWLRFQASWGFWGNTEWLEARVRYILKADRWRNVIRIHNVD
jgi:hypothetical protein